MEKPYDLLGLFINLFNNILTLTLSDRSIMTLLDPSEINSDLSEMIENGCWTDLPNISDSHLPQATLDNLPINQKCIAKVICKGVDINYKTQCPTCRSEYNAFAQMALKSENVSDGKQHKHILYKCNNGHVNQSFETSYKMMLTCEDATTQSSVSTIYFTQF